MISDYFFFSFLFVVCFGFNLPLYRNKIANTCVSKTQLMRIRLIFDSVLGDDEDDDDDDYLERFFDDILGEDDDDDDEEDLSPSTGLQQPAATVQQPAQQVVAANVGEEAPVAADYPGKQLIISINC